MPNQYNQYEDGPGTEPCADVEADTTTRLRDQIAENINDAKERVANMKEKVAEAGRKAADRIDAQREPAARTLEDTAETVRDHSHRFTAATNRAAKTTADKLESTAGYIRDNDVRTMLDDAQDVVRRHPASALAIAAVAGFVIGKVLTSPRS